MTYLEDSKIISLFYERSEQAIVELSQKYGAAIRKTAANILKSRLDVEECANDTYLGVWNTIPPQHPNPLVSYVCKIARNIAVNRYHANTAEKRNGNYDLVLDELEECLPSGFNVETELEAKELTEAINRFLQTLEKEEDLAVLTGINPNRISVRLFRVREKLKTTLLKEGLLP